jgi:hypothetical protein
MKLYRSRKHRHERLRGGGISTQDQKNRRDQKRRKSAMHREAVRSVMSKMYRQIRTDFVRPLEIQGDSSPLLLPRPLPCFVRGRGLFLDGVSSCLENTLLREPQTNRRIYFPTEDFSSSVRWVDGFDSEAFDLFLEKQEEWSDS